MKNIVVGIDFSKNSFNALKHAIAIAIKCSAKLHLVWVKTPGTAEAVGKVDEKTLNKIVSDKLNSLVDECKAEAVHCEANGIILQGKPAFEIIQYAGNLDDALIVMGTHGVSGYEEFFVGSNAFKVLSNSPVPVLILREGIEIHRDLTQIFVPIDTSFETLQKMKYSINFAKMFKAKLFLLGVISPVLPEIKHVINVQLGHASNMCEQANIRYEASTIEVKGTATKTLIDYAKNLDVNLMVIMREEEEDFSNFWMGSTTRQLVNNTPMPLLVIPNVNHFLINK